MKYVIETNKSELITKVAVELKNVEQVKPTSWSTFVKTGTHKQRPPVSKDWWYDRAASVLVKVTNRGPVGVSKLRTLYGGRKRRGHKPAEFRKASGNILRKILQQLEAAELIKHDTKGVHKGRVLTPKGASFLNTIAKGMIKIAPTPKKETPKPKVEEKKVEKKEEPKVTEAKEEKVEKKEEPKATEVKEEKVEVKEEPKPTEVKEEKVEVKEEPKPTEVKEEKVEVKEEPKPTEAKEEKVEDSKSE